MSVLLFLDNHEPYDTARSLIEDIPLGLHHPEPPQPRHWPLCILALALLVTAGLLVAADAVQRGGR